MQSVENLDDTLLERRTSHNTVVDDDEIIHPTLQHVISDVIDMRGKVVARVALGDECAQLDVLPRSLLRAHIAAKYLPKFLVCRLVVETFEFFDFEFVGIFLESLQHTVICHLGGVGYK